MVKDNPSPDKRVVYLALKTVFKGQNSEMRNLKPIRRLIQKHQNQHDITHLVREHNLEVLCSSAQTLLSQGIFSSTLKAKLQFPELFDPSPTQSAEKEASEAEAAKNEADAIEQAVQGRRDPDDSANHSTTQIQEAQEVSKSNDHIPSTSKSETFQHPAPSQTGKVPSLFPIYLPFKYQHKILLHLQNILEHACYEFGVRMMPDTLRERRWDCAESVELTRWTEVISEENYMTRTGKHGDAPTKEVLRSIANIRHTAVHRLHVTAKAIQQFILDAETLAAFLGDAVLARQVGKLRRDTRVVVDELEQNKHFLRSRLDETLKKIAEQRNELQRVEELAIAEMAKEDQEYGILAGQTLEKAIAPSEGSFSTAIDTEKDGTVRDDGDSTNHVSDSDGEDLRSVISLLGYGQGADFDLKSPMDE